MSKLSRRNLMKLLGVAMAPNIAIDAEVLEGPTDAICPAVDWDRVYGHSLPPLANGVPISLGTRFFVDPVNGNDANDGLSTNSALANISAAWSKCTADDVVIVYFADAVEE